MPVVGGEICATAAAAAAAAAAVAAAGDIFQPIGTNEMLIDEECARSRRWRCVRWRCRLSQVDRYGMESYHETMD